MINYCYLLGLNIILISRTKEKLEQVAKEIQTKNSNVQVKTIAVDFTSEIIS
jgi:short-subunit dehydrogenase